jgi:4-hydroxybenzoate polyprenyltransferase
MTALLWLGKFPPLHVACLGLITAFAGYTAVYALNDVIDYRLDREKIRMGGLGDPGDYLDAVMVRHPVAQGFLSLREGTAWVAAWSLVALVGAYLLNPVCVIIFLSGCLLEVIYCLLFKISSLRAIISGAVKTSGGVAAVFAVEPSPSPAFMIVLFFWLFLWEVGGQNVPADWTDLEEDRRIGAKTIPVQLGLEKANRIILISLVLTLAMNVVLFQLTAAHFSYPYVSAALLAGLYLLLLPAYRLYRSRERRRHAMVLFNRASYYPLALLLIVFVKIVI